MRDKLGRFIKGGISCRLGKRKYFYNCKYCNHLNNSSRKAIYCDIECMKKDYKNKRLSEKTKIKISKNNGSHLIENKLKISEALKNKPKSENHKQKIKEARKNQIILFTSSIEIKIQNYLKQLGIEFFTHQYIKEIKHGYQCDILIPSMKLIIECDGNYWHKYPIGNTLDHIRNKELCEAGFRILRLWESEIKNLSLSELNNKLEVV